jgi:hypothetical protein
MAGMASPFRDDEEAAASAIGPLSREQERLEVELARCEEEATRLRARRWMWAARLVVLVVVLVTSFFVGYASNGEPLIARCAAW